MKVLPLRVVLVLLALMSSVVLIAQNPISIQRLGTTASGVAVTTTLPVTVASLPLPSGASTSALQSTINTTLGSPFQAGGSIGNTTFTVTQGTGTNLHIVCDSGCSSSTAPADEAAFTAGTTPFGIAGGFFQTTATNNALTNGQMGAWQFTANRAGFVNLRTAAGVETGVAAAPLQVSLANTAANATAIKVDGSAVTQPVSIASGGVASGAYASGSISDGADVTQGAKADAKSTATDTTAITVMSVLKEISFMEQTPASRAVTNAGTFAAQVTSVSPTAASGDAVLSCNILSAASTNSTSCKGSAGNVFGYELFNTTTTVYYLRLYNSSSAPTCSSATGFIRSIPIPPAAAAGQVGGAIKAIGTFGVQFGTGIGYCLTGGSSSTDNTNAATGVFGEIDYK